jgi:hypothetical protein
MVVSVAILGILAAVIVPNATRYLYNKRLQADAVLLDSISYARVDFGKAVTEWPGRLSQLARQITGNVTLSAGDSTSCNGSETGGQVTFYNSLALNYWSGASTPTAPLHSGPYFGRPIPTSGLQLNIGLAEDKLLRLSVGSGVGFQAIVVGGVTYADARAFDKMVDGNDLPGASRTDTAGTVRWVNTPAGPRDTVTVRWYMGQRSIC